ncbi:hypothetical protein [Gordonia sp. NB41Y]|uniref:hypothetical protein n=1 Tax=Gordonia sp. NB41Y TaxID=875808 RepID=UPI0002BE02EF|nr:hypothetical protein [Gordonia sp. NB41Y]EMP13214.1 membrane protein [Gordonia sp. NB41Y]WLP91133.1 hypothetical protein Q9K23_02315 [Gordonia sp. NB41Y]
MPADPKPKKPRGGDARPTIWMIGFFVVALCVYFVILGKRAIDLIAEGTAVGIVLGLAVLFLPLLGVWMVVSTLRSGIEHQKLARIISEQGRELDVSDLPRRPSGRIERDAADTLFAQVKQEWEADPTDWRNTYRIARAYDYAGDRGRARQMMKRACEQFRESPDGRGA